MQYCAACGTQNPPTSGFCTNCGATMTVQQEGPAKTMGGENTVQQTPSHNQQPTVGPNPAQQQQINVNITSPQPAYQQPATIIRIGGRKDPTMAAIISLFLPGLGYAYFGDTGKGIGMFFVIIITYFFLIGFIIHIYSIFNSHSECKKYNFRMGYIQ
ncbi:MAG: hypothetical protein HeimC2_11240 [Candidatus Heimdallarchaeota archaeon LC_2]|nr:MAG: hypothetical protein HeimC2_11240 [Candidatus Heimdallarchaeota archaeon LC_2]